MKNIRIIIFYFFVNTVLLFSQDIDKYLGLINEGRINDVISALPELEALYKDDPSVHYLRAIVTEDAEKALLVYRNILKNYPDHKFADDVAMKIGEYLFSRGLYTQASKQFRLVPLVYSTTDHAQRATDLMVNSYFAVGHRDSAAFYIRQIRLLHPSLEFDKYGLASLVDPPKEAKLVKLDDSKVSAKLKNRKNIWTGPKANPKIPKKAPSKSKDYVAQVGAFSKYQNAQRIKNLLIQGGFNAEIVEVPSAGRRLHAVRIIRFNSFDEAEKEGERVKMKFGLEYRVLNRPK